MRAISSREASRGATEISAGMVVQPVHSAAGDLPPASISVVLANFNHGAFISRALSALLAQKPAAKEIIVVDDASTDDSVQIVVALQSAHPSIRLMRNATNRGVVASFRSGLEAASGDYVMFASADDFVFPGLFARALACLAEFSRAAFFCSGVVLIDGKSNRVLGIRPVTTPRRGRGYVSPADVRRAIGTTDFWIIGTSAIYRRELLAEVGYRDARLGSISDVLAGRALAFRHGFYFEPEVFAAYNKDPGSFSGRSALSLENSQRLLQTADAWIAENLPEDVRDDQRRSFVRRMAFGFARLWVIWRDGAVDVRAIAEILGLGALDRTVLHIVSRIPLASSLLTLAWMTIRVRPFGVLAMAGAASRALCFHCFGKSRVQRIVEEVARSSVAPKAVAGP